MRRVDLYEATMLGWARLDPAQRERFFRAGLKAALRLGPLQFRAWLLRGARQPPSAAPGDLPAFAISDDMVALLKQLPLRADGHCRSRDRARHHSATLWLIAVRYFYDGTHQLVSSVPLFALTLDPEDAASVHCS